MNRGRSVVKFVLASLGFLLAVLWLTTPSFEQVKKLNIGSDKYFYDRHGVVLQVIRADHSRRQLPWVSLEEVTPNFLDLLVKAEDRRFWYHPGMDPIGLVRAGFKSRSFGDQGGSTITMQLASRINGLNQSIRKHAPIAGKVIQIMQALGIEISWSKKEILTAYINLLPFRGENVGLPSAAQSLFDKRPSALSEQESAILVAMIRSPNAPEEDIARRSCLLLSGGALTDTRREDCLGIVKAKFREVDLTRKASYDAPKLAPHLARRILGTIKANGEIYTTLDANIQTEVLRAVNNRLSDVVKQNAHDAAVIVVDNQTRQILAYVGGSPQYSTAIHVDGASALRQSGSTLKPFIYGRALDRELITAATIVDDSPTERTVAAGGVYQPRNFDEKFRGSVTVRDALAGSLNIPAVRVIEMVGVEDAVSTLRSLGLKSLRNSDYYGPSLALGAADISLYELVEAYVTLANLGNHQPLTAVKIESNDSPKTSVFSPEAAVIVRSILSDNVARAPTFGFNSALFTSVETAVKTGTSKDMRDNWCIGFSDRYTVGVWVGNFSGDSMWNLTGVAGAAPIWSDVMHALHQNKSSRFSMPEGIRLHTVDVRFAFKNGVIQELFIDGTEPSDSLIEDIKKSYGVRISYPTDESLMAIDPDIPQKNQKIVFSANAFSTALAWQLDGVIIGPAHEEFSWAPVKGRHELAIIDKGSGNQVDRVRFVVR